MIDSIVDYDFSVKSSMPANALEKDATLAQKLAHGQKV